MIGRVIGYVVSALAVIGGIFLAGRRSQATKQTEKALKTQNKIEKVKTEVAQVKDGEVKKRFKSKWIR